MKDLPKLFEAVIIPYIIIASFTLICWLTGTGQSVPEWPWVFFLGGLSKYGITFSVGKIRKK